MRALIAGGGIGGLACAQGLARHGIDVTVLERDTELHRTGGYKLHLGPPALEALGGLLPPHLLDRLYASAVVTRSFELAVRDHRTRLLARVRESTGEVSVDVDRVTLRLLLADGLGARLRTGGTCVSFTTTEDAVTVTLADGHTIEGDVLVLADGAGSPLAEALAGEPTARPAGLIGVAGRAPWSALGADVRGLLDDAPLLAIGPGGAGLFATTHDPAGSARDPGARGAERDAGSPAAGTGLPAASAIWGLIAVEGILPPAPHRLPGAELREVVTGLLRRLRWAPEALDLAGAADPGTVAAFRLWQSDPARLAPWPAGRVTALGDAVHAMPPTGGQGAATALLDAASLVTALTGAPAGLIAAIEEHEHRMRAHAAPAVRESIQPLGWIRGTAHPAGAALTRVALPVAAAVTRLVTTVTARSTAAGAPAGPAPAGQEGRG